MGLNAIYESLFGKNHIQDGTVIDLAEHGRVGGVSTGQPFKFVSSVDPTTGTNPQTDGSQRTQIVDSDGNDISTLIQTLQELVQRLAPLGAAMSNGATLRVVLPGISSVYCYNVMTTTYYTPSYAAFFVTMAQSNLTATQANINNCIGA